MSKPKQGWLVKELRRITNEASEEDKRRVAENPSGFFRDAHKYSPAARRKHTDWADEVATAAVRELSAGFRFTTGERARMRLIIASCARRYGVRIPPLLVGDPKHTCAGNWPFGGEVWTGVSKTPVGYLVANPKKLPVIPPLPPEQPPTEPNAAVAICGECGIEIRPVMHYACLSNRCPLKLVVSW